MNITISTLDRSLASDLKRDAPSDFTITGVSCKGAKSLGEPPLYEIAIFIAGLGRDVAVGVFAAWLYGKTKNRSQSISVEGKKTCIDETEIKRCIEIKIQETRRHKIGNDDK